MTRKTVNFSDANNSKQVVNKTKQRLFSSLITSKCPVNNKQSILTKCEIRSQNRDQTKYPNPSDVVYDIGTHRNVTNISIDPVGFEFPNTMDAISPQNNKIYWCFLLVDDASDSSSNTSNHVQTYSTEIDRGNYTLEAVLDAILKAMNAASPDYSFTVNYIRESRLIEFSAYANVQLGQDPLLLTANSPEIIIQYPKHNLAVNDIILLSGVSGSLGGLSSGDVSGTFSIVQILSSDSFTVHLSNGDTPYMDGAIGGSVVKVGNSCLFKFLDKTSSIIPYLGFVPGDSAVACDSITYPSILMNCSTNGFVITSLSEHHYQVGDILHIMSPTVPIISKVIRILSPNTFQVDQPMPLTLTTVANTSLVTVYKPNISLTGNLPEDLVMSGPAQDLILPEDVFYSDANSVIVRLSHDAAEMTKNIVKNNTMPTFRLSTSLRLGFATLQSNFVNGISIRYINLQGDTAVYLQTPDIETNYHSAAVTRIFAKIQLSDVATTDLFNTVSTKQGHVEWPNTIHKIHFRLVDRFNHLVDMMGMEYSFTIYVETEKNSPYSHKLYYPEIIF
jgi:hypothetical protein